MIRIIAGKNCAFAVFALVWSLTHLFLVYHSRQNTEKLDHIQSVLQRTMRNDNDRIQKQAENIGSHSERGTDSTRYHGNKDHQNSLGFDNDHLKTGEDKSHEDGRPHIRNDTSFKILSNRLGNVHRIITVAIFLWYVIS